jgi:hypothetical protein
MEKLIEALNIFLKYGNKDYPFHCEHDQLTIDYDPSEFSKEDLGKLAELGFHADEDNSDFKSYRYGSC